MTSFGDFALTRIVDTVATRFGYSRPVKAEHIASPAQWLRADGEAERFSVPDGGLYRNQIELYQRLSWVAIAVSLVAQAAAGTPLSVKQLVGEDKRDVPNHAFEKLLQRPNPLMSRFELLESTYAYRNLTGNAYWWLNRPNANTPPIELWSLPSHKVKPIPDGNMFLRGYLYFPGGQDSGQKGIPLEPWEVVHFRRFHPLNSYVGLSPIEALAVVATGDLAMQKWNTNFFGKDAAKQPGFLAFSDPIAPGEWERMKAEYREQYGSLKRTLMMLQNVGKGGVQWVSTAMSQKDMEFLGARTFNREEIFALFAPGLSSVLAVNATEANAVAGKSTMLEFAIWPQHVSVAEKLTNDVLPAYGVDLIAEFDDVRSSDEQLELSKIAEYSKTHTIDQINKEFYGEGPLGDDRGKLLPAEVGSGLTDARDPAQLAEEKQARADAMAATMQGATSTTAPRPEGTRGDDAPTQDPPRVSPGEAAVAREQEPVLAGKALDLDRWQRKAVKRLRAGKAAVCEFESDHLSVGELDAIADGLKTATTADEVAQVFALKLIADELTPAEQALASKLTTVLRRSGTEMVKRIIGGEVLDLTVLDARLRAAIVPTLLEVMLDQATTLAETIGLDFDPAHLATSAAQWAQTYSFDLVKGITGTTQKVLQTTVAQYQSTPGMTRDDLVRMLNPAFGERRAQTIATTEITRAAATGTRNYQTELKQAGVEMERVNRTNADDSTCEICGPLDGKPESEWPDEAGPPWHVKCRCSVTLRLKK